MKNKLIKSLTLFGCLVMALTSCEKRDLSAGDSLLSEGWKVQSSAKISFSGEDISSSQMKTDEWYDAIVPSTVMGTLIRNGIYTDVLEGMNYENIDKSLFDTTWWYRTEFELPRLAKGQHVSLMFDGISYAANIWLNGKQIAARDSVYGTFRRHRLDITEAAQEKNVLAVEVCRAQPGEPNIGFVDWNPRPADESMGIFREVRVLMTDEVSMENSVIHSKVNTETLDEAWLTVETQLTNESDQVVTGQLTGTLEGKTFSIPVSLAAKESKRVKVTSEEIGWLHLKNPRLWWCHNMGNPEMYSMDLAFEIDGKASDGEIVNFGVREIKDYFTEEGYRGFMLNGKKVLVRSAGWTDDIFLRDTPATNEVQVQYVRDMNLNSIRFENIWGTSQNVYDLCDRYGLLVLVGWSCHWEWDNYLGSPCDEFGGIKSEADMDLIARSLNDQVLWLRNHPAIIAWFVGSDMIPRPELEKRYQAYLSQIDDRPYIGAAKELTSEVTGATGMKMAGPYDYVAPDYWYSEEAPGGAFGFNTETGIGAQLPVIESIRRMIPSDKLWPIGKEWDYHCTVSDAAMNSLEVLKESIAARYGKPKDLEDFLRKADWLNYEGTRTMFEAFRVNIPRATGIVQWMLNSAWPSLYWQLYDHYLIPTAAYYSVKKSNMPQQLIYHYRRNVVYAVNEGAETVRMQGMMSLYGLDGKILAQQTTELEVAPYTVVKAFDVPAVKDNAFLYLQLNDKKDVCMIDNFYCLSVAQDVNDWANTNWIRTPVKKSADFTGLADMPLANCDMSVTVRQEKDNAIVEVTLENDSAVLAFFVRLSLKNEKGELLYPVFWEDNYLSVIPGGKRTLKCVVSQSVAKAQSVLLTASGWNVPEKKIELSLGNTK